MKKLATKFKIGIALVLMFCLSICFVPALSGVYAEGETQKLSISDILKGEEYKDQEITNKLPFNTTFEGADANTRENGWQTSGELTTGNSTVSANLTSNDEIANTEGIKYSDIGAAEGDHAMLLICTKGTEENTTGGVAAIESKELITIPARSIYLLTVKVKLVNLKKNVGLYITLDRDPEKTDDDIKISGIKTTVEKDAEGKEKTVYATYAFLIQGSELYNKTARLKISLGYKNEDEIKSEVGVAAIDDLRMFSLTSDQKTALKGAANVTVANFSDITTANYEKVKNGSFNTSINQGYDISNIKLFTPANFTQTTSPNNPETTWGIVNTNNQYFAARFPGMIHPGVSTYTTSDNNILMLNNNSNTNQKVVSDKFTASKNQIYEFTFEFCTPATMATYAEETNSVSFYLKNGDDVIYKMENIYSYAEADHEQNTSKWQRLSLIIQTAEKAKDLTFEIVFGTETEAKSGTVYVDNIKLDTRSEDVAFKNIYENALELKDTDPVEYLEKGNVSLEDVKNLKENNIVKIYTFEDKADAGATDKPTDDKKEETEKTDNLYDTNYIITIVVAITLPVALVIGLAVYYLRKIKLPTRKKKSKKQTYDRNSTLKVHVEKKEEKKAKQVKLAPKIEKSKTKQEEIVELEKAYNNKEISLDKYLKQREKLEAEIMQVEDLISE